MYIVLLSCKAQSYNKLKLNILTNTDPDKENPAHVERNKSVNHPWIHIDILFTTDLNPKVQLSQIIQSKFTPKNHMAMERYVF